MKNASLLILAAALCLSACSNNSNNVSKNKSAETQTAKEAPVSLTATPSKAEPAKPLLDGHYISKNATDDVAGVVIKTVQGSQQVFVLEYDHCDLNRGATLLERKVNAEGQVEISSASCVVDQQLLQLTNGNLQLTITKKNSTALVLELPRARSEARFADRVRAVVNKVFIFKTENAVCEATARSLCEISGIPLQMKKLKVECVATVLNKEIKLNMYSENNGDASKTAEFFIWGRADEPHKIYYLNSKINQSFALWGPLVDIVSKEYPQEQVRATHITIENQESESKSVLIVKNGTQKVSEVELPRESKINFTVPIKYVTPDFEIIDAEAQVTCNPT